MIELDTNPAVGLLLIGIGAFVILGFLTLSGTWALLIYIVLLLVAGAIVYGIGTRVAAWLRGERPLRRGSEESDW